MVDMCEYGQYKYTIYIEKIKEIKKNDCVYMYKKEWD